jgi:hypothetical protein
MTKNNYIKNDNQNAEVGALLISPLIPNPLTRELTKIFLQMWNSRLPVILGKYCLYSA